eukprot:scaffold9199_cov61-Phaeocystis_antarctica.AAC.4
MRSSSRSRSVRVRVRGGVRGGARVIGQCARLIAPPEGATCVTIAPSLKMRTCGSWSALYCLCAVAHELWLAYTKRAFGQSDFRRSTSGRA